MYFDTYTSNTLAAGGNQALFRPADPTAEQVGRVYYTLFEGGTLAYSLLFADTVDSTFADGSISRAQDTCGGFEITRVALGLADGIGEPHAMLSLGGGHVPSGGQWATEPVVLTANAGDCLCVEIGFRGTVIPCHKETQIPVFLKQGDDWVPAVDVPLPSMIGCARTVKKRIAYLGDSITQGIGVQPNSYLHWNALLSEALGHEYAYWNLGLGFGRAMDAACDGAWLHKAKQADVVTVCFGVNDIGRGRTAEQILADLACIVERLQQAGCRVLLQSVPPFTYTPENFAKWQAVNRGIREQLAAKADAFFDVEAILGSDTPLYGGHPNEEGCRLWAEALLPVIQPLLND